jgi:hypothetical protein
LLATPRSLLGISLPFNENLPPALVPLSLFRLACPPLDKTLIDEPTDPILFHF